MLVSQFSLPKHSMFMAAAWSIYPMETFLQFGFKAQEKEQQTMCC
jgi:hypothetical protein